MLLLLRASGSVPVETTPQTHTNTGVFKDDRRVKRPVQRKIKRPSNR